MAHKVAVITESEIDSGIQIWWKNFLKSCPYKHPGKSAQRSWPEELAKYNGQDLPSSVYIEFSSEEDFLMFVLRFT